MGSGPRTRGACRASRRRARALASAVLLSLLAALVLAPSALAKRQVHIAFSCEAVSFDFTGFPVGEEDTVTALVKEGSNVLAEEVFTFTGPDGSTTLPISVLAGRHAIHAESHWKTNGVYGESGHHAERLECSASKPSLTIQKLQAMAGSGKTFEAKPLAAQVGQTVEYKMIVSNTGDVPVIITGLGDEKCDPGTLHGGQGETPLEPRAQTEYRCSRTLTEAGTFTNVATVTAEADGKTLTGRSNQVEVTATLKPKPRFEVQKLQEIAGAGGSFTTAQLSATVGQTVDYEILVRNTGNTALVFSEFADIYCDAGTISGGPGGTSVAPGSSTTYTCSRKLTEAITYENQATVTGAPSGGGESATLLTNTVKVTASEPASDNETPASKTTTGSPSGTPGNTATGGPSGKAPAGGGVLSSKTSKNKKHKPAKPQPHTTAHRTPRFTG